MSENCPRCGMETADRYLGEYGLTIEFACGTRIGDMGSYVGQTCLRRQISVLTEKLEALQNVCAEAYQLAGMCGAPEKALDNLCAAAQGEPIPHESFLPVYEKDLELGEKLEAWREYGKEAQEIFGYSTHEEPWFIKLRELGEVE